MTTSNPPGVDACMTLLELLEKKKRECFAQYLDEQKTQAGAIRQQEFGSDWSHTVRDYKALADASAAVQECDEQMKVLWKIKAGFAKCKK